jgi:excisionase family DNA binding protein
MITEELMTTKQASELIGVSRVMVHYWIHDRDLPATRIGPKCWVVRRVDAERMKDKRANRY